MARNKIVISFSLVENKSPLLSVQNNCNFPNRWYELRILYIYTHRPAFDLYTPREIIIAIYSVHPTTICSIFSYNKINIPISCVPLTPTSGHY